MNLPIARQPRRWRVNVVHGIRVALVVLLLMAIPQPERGIVGSVETPPDSLPLQSSLPAGATAIDQSSDADGLWAVRDDHGVSRGYVARTMPNAETAIGYRGPSEAWIVFDTSKVITAAGLLDSFDTEEHVDAVRNDADFANQFVGWTLDETETTSVDGVSGATLTSLAMAEGILRRLRGSDTDESPISLLFTNPTVIDEVMEWYPAATKLTETDGQALVYDANMKELGSVLRTGPHCDDVIGYQGASELLLMLDLNGTITGAQVRGSFDNEPYLQYVRDDDYFWKTFIGKSISATAEIDLEIAGVEGVSGATMSSVAIAETIVKSAQSKLRLDQTRQTSELGWWRKVRLSRLDALTLGMLLLCVVSSRLGWFRSRVYRSGWLVGVVVVIGLWTGNLMSLALFAGWSSSGIAWQLAPSLAVLGLVAVASPPTTKSNVYCNHLCPHGAMQQLLRPGVSHRKNSRQLLSKISRWLTWLPGTILCVAYIVLILSSTTDLSSWEPFHAYLWRVAGWTSIAFAVGSLVLSRFIPMGYCRLGCPTGSLLDYLRRSARSDRLRWADGIAVGLLGFAWLAS